MSFYIGIDLGTTNSAICSYDGEKLQVHKSPEQNDVTPSAIFVDRRGNRYYGRRAYEMAPVNEKNAATLFKRYMGTQTRFELSSAGVSLTPEECSAEILKVLFGYLPDSVQADPETSVVITVPAAFNQVKKDATLEAAQLAGIGRVALMQEPVAAVMSVVHQQPQDGIFLVYDLGGGTFDVSIAENAGGRVRLLAQGGKEMCGGRDWDRLLFERVIAPWLHENFHLPDHFERQDAYKRLTRLAHFAAEQAKIELSGAASACIRMDEDRLSCVDLDGSDVYLDIDITRKDLNELIAPMIAETVEVVRSTLQKSGLSPEDAERIVFIGGPTNYKPLRDQVSAELGVPGSNDINPMTAVAEGAAIFAESIDWSSERHNRKASTQEAEGTPSIRFRYESRCASDTARLVFLVEQGRGLTAEITSQDTGWSSGRIPLTDGAKIELPLSRSGENRFSAAVYNAWGKTIPLTESQIVISRTLASVSAIPASHCIAVKVLDKLGGTAVPVYLVRENDPLPKTSEVVFKAGQTLKAGSHEALVFTLWEGSIPHPIEDNRYIGTYKIPGTSFDIGVIPTGADVICRYEMSDSGTLHLGVSVPCIGADFGDQNFYSRQEGQLDLSNTRQIVRESIETLERIQTLSRLLQDPRLSRARAKANAALSVSGVSDPEKVQTAYNDLLEARKLLAQLRQDHQRQLRQLDLDGVVDHYNSSVRQYARDYEQEDIDELIKTAHLAISRGSADFDELLAQLRRKCFIILWKEDWYAILLFKRMCQSPEDYTDAERFRELRETGNELIRDDCIGRLRSVINELNNLRVTEVDTENMLEDVNVIRG